MPQGMLRVQPLCMTAGLLPERGWSKDGFNVTAKRIYPVLRKITNIICVKLRILTDRFKKNPLTFLIIEGKIAKIIKKLHKNYLLN